jgi:hypothetical protein
MNPTSLPTFYVFEDKILINKVALRFVEGDLILAGTLDVSGESKFDTLQVSNNLTAKYIKAETLQVRNLITDWDFKPDNESTNSLNWNYNSEEELNGKGLNWKQNGISTQLLYRSGGRLWTNANVDIEDGKSYKINNSVVLNQDTLGNSVIKSQLQQVGILTSLEVSGDAIFYNSLKATKLNVGEINGTITFNGSNTINGDLTVRGPIVATTIRAERILDQNGKEIKLDEIQGNEEPDLYGRGISWSYGDNSYQLVYNTNGRLWTNLSMDLSANNSYRIGDIPVLSTNELGPQVIKSNLQKVGVLKDLSVSGNANFGEFAFFNGDMFRVGLGTEEPDAALHIHDFGVDIIVGTREQEVASIGTKTNHGLDIITDDTARLSIKNSGEIVIGSQSSRNANVTIYGQLQVDSIVSDSRIDRFSPLEFKASGDTRVYGLGLIWRDSERDRSFLLSPSPDRFKSSEHLELAENRSYYINGKSVISETVLGNSVTDSALTTVGVLTSLTVAGNANLNVLTAADATIKSITSSAIKGDQSIRLQVADDTVYFADSYGISIGNKQNTARPVKIFGPLSVGVNNPDPDLGFTVAGDVSLGGKKFVTGDFPPVEGVFNKGDICWNTNPTPGNYVGWICIVAGTPGQWATFGAISIQ